MDDVGSIVEPTSSLALSRRHPCRFSNRYLHNVNTRLFCTADRMFRTIIMQNFRLNYACFPIKIDEVWIDRFCVRYDWWRRLQRTSSVSPVCDCTVFDLFMFTNHAIYLPSNHIVSWIIINSLWPSNAIWRHRFGSILAQIMACCLVAPSHCVNQSWLVINLVWWHQSQGNFMRDIAASNH